MCQLGTGQSDISKNTGNVRILKNVKIQFHSTTESTSLHSLSQLISQRPQVNLWLNFKRYAYLYYIYAGICDNAGGCYRNFKSYNVPSSVAYRVYIGVLILSSTRGTLVVRGTPLLIFLTRSTHSNHTLKQKHQ